ncbi:creatininase family protein [Sphingobium sp. B11D3D]|uniref:creatininase family protein n=1 Tax=Sphingobium sp. B11D3D TaxID=2940576 RepID=UPI0022246223|nr:creatininase family protein [Sphingobium sp. B11D3D]MCW2370805.1 creatinine amidohydrolase [Sphingobium sp. B11D3D]
MKRPFDPAVRALSLAGLAALLFSGAAPALAQSQAGAQQTAAKPAPKMRSRLMTTLTGWEVEDYLKRNDVIFVPVGPVEQNGGNPTDVEYVIPLAYAQELAEKADGLVMPYLAYFYPGGTTTSRGTVYVSTSDSLPYLKALTRSLIRQGFRRIIFLTSHGPSQQTMLPLVREIFDEEHVPVLWMGTDMVRKSEPGQPRPGFGDGPPNGRNLVSYGAYQLVGRLSDMPVGLSQPEHEIERDPSAVSRYVPPFSGTPAGSFYPDAVLHGGFVKPVTEQERAQWGREGADLIRSQVASFDVNGLLTELRKRDEFTKKLEKKYGDLLPGRGR